MADTLPKNLRAAPLIVSHADLARLNDESPYKSRCPVCPKGVLLVARHPVTFELLNLDHCVACGQRVIYTDATIAGEPVRGTSDQQAVIDAMLAHDRAKLN